MMNCAPATASAGSELPLTTTGIRTVSPGVACFSGITHSTEPSVSSITWIAPSTRVTFSVMFLPFVSLTNASDHLTA